jgi:hypothetical protein
MQTKPMKRFDRLLYAMATQPEPSGSLQETIEHPIRRLAQVMAIIELATQMQPFSL